MDKNQRHIKSTNFLPTSAKEVEALGWTELDVILFTGDAYIDHPSFGIAVIARMLHKLGLKVAIVPQPNWRDDLRDFKKLGKPRLFFGVTAGNMDSMVNHYTALKRLRSNDAYTPGGKAGQRPDYATIVYTKIVKQLFPDTPVIIGGVEASLRRLTHYDYWSDSLKPSILIESGADLLLYGMAEKALKELVTQLQSGKKIDKIRQIRQTAFVIPQNSWDDFKTNNSFTTIELKTFESCKTNKKAYGDNFRIFEEESNKMNAAQLTEANGNKIVVVNPHFSDYTPDEIDEPYALPYTRLPHPRYQGKEAIPAYDMIKDSVNIHRGCFGGCSFCTISAHQGKFVLSRSEASILAEVQQMADMPGFTGTITDLGGPSANMYRMAGKDLTICSKCKKPSCIHPVVCPNLKVDHNPLLEIYKKAGDVKNVKNIFIGSGVRYDLIYSSTQNTDKKAASEYLQQLVKNHVSGRLKVAPEHTSDKVLKLMRKPSFQLFKRLNADMERINNSAGKEQQIIPYFISSHPGSTLQDMAELAVETKQLRFKLEQVQDFTPTPMTLATCIYYTGFDPYTGEKVFTVKTEEDKKAQQSFFFWYKPEMKTKIRALLAKLGRKDLEKKLL